MSAAQLLCFTFSLVRSWFVLTLIAITIEIVMFLAICLMFTRDDNDASFTDLTLSFAYVAAESCKYF